MIESVTLNDYLNNLLDCGNFKDYAPNGLQIEGQQNIHTICTAVTASAEVIKLATEAGAEALLVHHGYFWKGETPVITGTKRQRIAGLINNDMNLFSYHLPLDCHPELGNNAQIAKLLGCEAITMHHAGEINNLLWSGSLTKPMQAKPFNAFLSHKFNRPPIHIGIKDKPIKRIAWCSGAAQDYIEDAAKLGIDAYISGEISERTYYQAIELGIHYFSCGHHATERLGIQALGEHLAANYDLKHQFIDSNNPI